MRSAIAICSVLCAVLFQNQAQAVPIYASNFSELSTAINTANLNPGSTIYLAPGIYSGGALPYISSSLTISLDPMSGAPLGSAILKTDPTGSKGLLTVPSDVSNVNLSVNGLTFEDANISDALGGNAAGIRYQSAGAASLQVMNSSFLGNQTGILTGSGADDLLLVSISDSLFANNGSISGFDHGIYIFGQSLDVTNSTFCGTISGHDIKSRTAMTTVAGSSFYDGISGSDPRCAVGSASYSVDLPNGGQVDLRGNDFFQGPESENFAIVSYGEEGLTHANNSFVATDNAFESTITGSAIQELSNGTPTCLTPVQSADNIVSANLVPVRPASCVTQLAPEPQPVDEPPTSWMVVLGLLGLMAWGGRSGSQFNRRSGGAAI
jgi:hypothetical protein